MPEFCSMFVPGLMMTAADVWCMMRHVMLCQGGVDERTIQKYEK